MKSSKLLIFGCVFVMAYTAVAMSQNLPERDVSGMLRADSVPDQVLVRFKNEISADSITAAHRAAGHRRTLRSFHIVPNLHLVEVRDVKQALHGYLSSPAVVYAEPNYVGKYFATPNDEYYVDEQWDLQNAIPGGIRAEEAWDQWRGDSDFKVAILDMGFTCTHPDLVGNMWTNPEEQPGDANDDNCPGECEEDDDGDGLVDEDSLGQEPNDPGYLDDLDGDDDENGYVDDIHGYDTVLDQGNPCQFGGEEHGTAVAGIIGADTDNTIGVAGINWDIDMVFLRTTPVVPISNIVDGIQYVVDEGIKLANCSWGLYFYDPEHEEPLSLLDVLHEASDTLFVFSAGQIVEEIDLDDEDDQFWMYPHEWKRTGELENIMVVLGTTPMDVKVESSFYGEITVDLGAPGSDLFTTTSNPELYRGGFGGTSFAAPHVTGVAALVMSRFPMLSPLEVRDQMLLSVRDVPALGRYCATSGIVDASAAISIAGCGVSECGDCGRNPFSFCTTVDTGNPSCISGGDLVTCDPGETIHTVDCECRPPSGPPPHPVCPSHYRRVVCR